MACYLNGDLSLAALNGYSNRLDGKVECQKPVPDEKNKDLKGLFQQYHLHPDALKNQMIMNTVERRDVPSSTMDQDQEKIVDQLGAAELPLKKRLTKRSLSIPQNQEKIQGVLSQQDPWSLNSSKKPFTAATATSTLLTVHANRQEGTVKLEDYQISLSSCDSKIKILEEKDAFIIPLPFHPTSWREVVKLAHSIMMLSQQNYSAVQEHLKEIRKCLEHLSRDEIRQGKLEALKQDAIKGEYAIKFEQHLNALKQDLQTDLPFRTMYRMEFFDFSAKRQYVLGDVGNPEAETTIRLYRKKKENGHYHYDLLISRLPVRRHTF